MIDPSKLAAIRANIFDGAHGSVPDWNAFPWHTSSGQIDTDQPNSSQAFCISVWGTFAAPTGAAVRSALQEQLLDSETQKLGVPIATTARLEFSNETVLGEGGIGQPTSLDVFFQSPSACISVESKLTEAFGSCSQPANGDCSGTYGPGSDLKRRTQAWCRLQLADGIRTARLYWNVMNAISRPGMYPAGQPCAFAGPGYQVMRTIAFSARFAEHQGLATWRTIFGYVRAPEPDDAVDQVVARLLPEHQSKVLRVDYRTLAARLLRDQDPIAKGLGIHMMQRLP